MTPCNSVSKSWFRKGAKMVSSFLKNDCWSTFLSPKKKSKPHSKIKSLTGALSSLINVEGPMTNKMCHSIFAKWPYFICRASVVQLTQPWPCMSFWHCALPTRAQSICIIYMEFPKHESIASHWDGRADKHAVTRPGCAGFESHCFIFGFTVPSA